MGHPLTRDLGIEFPRAVKAELDDLIERTQKLVDIGPDYAAFQAASAANRSLKAALRSLKDARRAT